MTIRRRVRVALLLMLFVPLFLMAGAFSAARRFGLDVNRLDPLQKSLLAELNRRVNEDPGSLSDLKALAALDREYGQGGGGWVILRDGAELYRSASMLKGAGSFGGSRWRSRSFSASSPLMKWDFRFADGHPGELQLYAGFSMGSPFRGPGWLFVFIGVLILSNGLLGWWVSSAVVSPLAKLRDAALRIGDGDLRFALSRDGPGEFGQVTAAFETMREKLQSAVARQVAEEASRKELIAHVSHDLRTPINLIRGYAEGIRDGVASTAEMRARYLDTILERAGELERLIELLFSYSTMDLDGVRPNLADLDLAPYLNGLRDSLSEMYPAAAISLEVMGDEGVPARQPRRVLVRADAELTRRVMVNLVENAVTHGGKPETAVRWKVARLPAGRVEVTVADNGAGVPSEDLPRIFEPFFRGDRARTRSHGGTGAGLGLSIVRKLMEAQGGSVRAAAAAGGGLEVTLTFVEAGERA
jgi:signal transduction histidine kinase